MSQRVWPEVSGPMTDSAKSGGKPRPQSRISLPLNPGYLLACCRGGGRTSLQIFIGSFGEFRQMAQQADLERPVSVDRNRKPHHALSFAVDMMAAGDPEELPAAPLDEPSELVARR